MTVTTVTSEKICNVITKLLNKYAQIRKRKQISEELRQKLKERAKALSYYSKDKKT